MHLSAIVKSFKPICEAIHFLQSIYWGGLIRAWQFFISEKFHYFCGTEILYQILSKTWRCSNWNNPNDPAVFGDAALNLAQIKLWCNSLKMAKSQWRLNPAQGGHAQVEMRRWRINSANFFLFSWHCASWICTRRPNNLQRVLPGLFTSISCSCDKNGQTCGGQKMFCSTMTILQLNLPMSSTIFLQKTACRLFDRLRTLRTCRQAIFGFF